MIETPPIQYALTGDGVQIAYAVHAGGSGVPAILVPAIPSQLSVEHSAGLHYRTAQWIEQLGPDRDVIRYDRRGTGGSQRGELDYSSGGLARDIAAVVDALGLPRVAVIAAGSGCYAALQFVHDHTERVVALCVPNLAGYRGGVGGGDAVARSVLQIAEADWDAFSELWPVHVAGSLRAAATIQERPSLIREIQTQRDFLAQVNALSDVDLTPLLSEIDVPSAIYLDREVVAGRQVDQSRRLAATLPSGELISSAGSDDVVTVTAKYLRRIAPSEAPASGNTHVDRALQTILFTDLEGSTALTQRVGDEAAQEVLRGHDRAVREALEQHDGREVKHTGDGIMASFSSAVSAVRAGLAIQRAMAGGEVRVRVGMNAGEPIAEHDDFFGTTVQLAARIADRADPGQVLVPNVVRELCAGKGFEFLPVGEATLKGIDEPVMLFEVSESAGA